MREFNQAPHGRRASNALDFRAMRFTQEDTIALLAVPLVVAAFKANGAVFASICLTLAGATIVLVVVRHGEFFWKQRFVICGFVVAGVLALTAYLYQVNL